MVREDLMGHIDRETGRWREIMATFPGFAEAGPVVEAYEHFARKIA